MLYLVMENPGSFHFDVTVSLLSNFDVVYVIQDYIVYLIVGIIFIAMFKKGIDNSSKRTFWEKLVLF